MILDLNSKVAEIIEKQAEILGEIKAIRAENNMLKSKVEDHLQEHKERPEKFLYQVLGKIGKRKWIAIFIAFFFFQVVLAALIFKFGIEKILSIFK